jgi:signal transduction histidine kinase
MHDQRENHGVRMSGPGSRNIATKLLLLLILMTLAPVGIAAVLMFTTARHIQTVSLEEGKSALITTYESTISERTRDYAEALGKELLRVEAGARTVASMASLIYSNPETFIPGRTRSYARHPLGFFWTPRDEGSNVFAGSEFELNERTMKEVHLTEYLDPVMRSVYEGDENIAYVYFTSVSRFARGYPWFDAEAVVTGGTLPPDLRLDEHPIFFLAGPALNPEKRAIWSEVYIDVTGRGFMVTCSCPVYTVSGRFAGVVGVDVTVERLSKKILELGAGEGSYAFLMGRHGAVIAFTEGAAHDIGYEPGLRLDQFNLFERARDGLRDSLQGMTTASSGTRRITVDETAKIISYHPVVTTDWFLGFVMPVEWVTRAAFRIEEKIRARTTLLRQQMLLFFTFLVLAVLFVTFVAAKKIANPVRELAEGAKRIGTGELGYRVPEASDDELGDLARSFNEMARSLTEREEELARIQKKLIASESLSSMGKVAAAVAHEIRNILGVIKNSAYYLRDKAGAGAMEEQKIQIAKHLKIIQSEIGIAESIISDLLSFASPLVPHKKRIDLHSLLRDVVERAALPESVRVKLNFDRAPRCIEGDPILLGLVFLNILQNARQAMPQGGVLSVSSLGGDEETSVTIADSGTGIPEENLKLLFEPFYTTKAKGIGLGLSLSKRIVEEHGGRIEVKSEVGKGTSFTVILPENRDSTRFPAAPRPGAT